MIITVKVYGVGRFTYPDLQTAIDKIVYLKRKSLYFPWVDPTDKNQVHYFDEYDLRIPHEVIIRMIANLPLRRWTNNTLIYGYKRGRYRGYRHPRHKQALIEGRNVPTTWDDRSRASNYNRNWKQFRRTQYVT